MKSTLERVYTIEGTSYILCCAVLCCICYVRCEPIFNFCVQINTLILFSQSHKQASLMEDTKKKTKCDIKFNDADEQITSTIVNKADRNQRTYIIMITMRKWRWFTCLQRVTIEGSAWGSYRVNYAIATAEYMHQNVGVIIDCTQLMHAC